MKSFSIHRKPTIKPLFKTAAPSFDAQAIHATIQQALQSAGLDSTTGPLRDMTETIRRALAVGPGAQSAPPVDDAAVIDVVAPGRFTAHVFRSDAGSRRYKVYVPAGTFETPPALIVMLHGCTQSADDFAAGTRMNRHADAQRFLVVYPEQGADANASKCWNWFKPQDQQRGAGEPALLAGLVRAVAQQHGADPQRIFVAGLSAGAAMAVVLGETYPELFAAVGVHSGLPYASAHDIPSALAAMKGGRSGLAGLKPEASAAGAAGAPRAKAQRAVPVIVFHGDRDHTVQQTNAAHIVQQARRAHGFRSDGAGLGVRSVTGVTPGGRRYSRTVDTDDQGQARIESWTLHGAGHAWSGGDASGSYTDSAGPDASAEMVRFFLALRPAAAAT